MPEALDTAVISYKRALDLILMDRKVTVDFLKIAAIGLTMQFLTIAIAIGVAFMWESAGAQSGLAMIGAIILLALVVFVFCIANGAISASAYNVVDEKTKGKGIKILEKAKALLIPIAVYTLLILGLLVTVFILPLAVTMISADAGAILAPLLFLALAAGFIAFLFLTQQSIALIALEGKGAMESFRRSYSLVRGNLGAFIFFDMILIFILVVEMVGAAMLQGALGLLGDSLIILPFMVIISLADAVIRMIFIVPPAYFLWKQLK